MAKAWLTPDRDGGKVAVVLTEFIDPSGREVYFRVPDPASTSPIPLRDDEIVSWPNEFVNAHVRKALYGPKSAGDLEDMFEIRGDVVADLAADYVNPQGQTGLKAEFPDSSGGRWSFANCRNDGLLSTAKPGDAKPLASQFKAFGSPLGYAYGLEGQADGLGFVSDYAPSGRQEDAWRQHYTERMFDRVLAAPERPRFLYTHPVADTACHNVFRWTPAPALRRQDLVLSGRLYSNLGNGVVLRVINWDDDGHHELLATLDSSQARVGQCGHAEFVLRLPAGKVGQHLDFVLHNGGSHVCDATALQLRVHANVRQGSPQADVTETIQARFHRRLLTPLAPHAVLLGPVVSPGHTLKLEIHYWQDNRVTYRELPDGSDLDLRP